MNLHPVIRNTILPIYRPLKKLKNNLSFQIWKFKSQQKYGDRIWVSIYDSSKIVVNTNDYRGYRIAQLKGTQKEKIKVWSDLVSFKPDICFDIGANYGEFTSVLNHQKCIAIEANPNLVPCLKESFKNNKDIQILPVAVSDNDGKLTFFFNDSASGSGSIGKEVPSSEQILLNNLGTVRSVEIKTQKLDTIVKSELTNSPQSLVMKIDIEGFELLAFKGATELLSNAKWWRAMVEFCPKTIEQVGLSVNETWNMYRKFNGIIFEEKVKIEQLKKWDQKLPESAPETDCEILIGCGSII